MDNGKIFMAFILALFLIGAFGIYMEMSQDNKLKGKCLDQGLLVRSPYCDEVSK